MTNSQPLAVPGARQNVEIENPQGIFYKIRVAGEPVKRRRGGWQIPLRNGGTARVTSRGLIPGFQKLYFDGERIFDMGGGVGLAERITMFSPLLLIIWGPFGLVIGLILFFLGIPAVKNMLMPRGLRIALPLVNMAAGGFILYLITGRFGIFG